MDLVDISIKLILLMFSLGVHECAHAWTAYKFGDNTAASLGRMTLNPIPHIDPIGLIAIIFSPVGWAKPVPVNPANVRNPSIGLPLIAVAGPVSNLIQMIMGCALYSIYQKFSLSIDPSISVVINDVIGKYIIINLWLALFNMFPIYPLDGSKVITFFMPDDMADRYENNLRNMGYFPLIILFVLNSLTGGAILAFWFDLWKPVFSPIFSLFSIPFY